MLYSYKIMGRYSMILLQLYMTGQLASCYIITGSKLGQLPKVTI